MRFSKMHGLGNDFMIVDAITQEVSLSKNVVKFLADRRFGVGFDQLLLVEASYEQDVDFNYRIFNSDGNEVYQCGNGVRCFARFVHIKQLTDKSIIRVSTKTRRMVLSIIGNEVCVDMGEPIFDPKKVPFTAVTELKESYLIRVSDQNEMLCGVVSMGNPHCVLVVKDIKAAQVAALGSILENHSFFPEQANVSFMEIVSYKHIRLRVYERGIGETPACGSAACAAVSVGIRQGLLYNYVRVDLLGGSLRVSWKGIGHSLYMYGPAIHVYDGCIYL